MYAKRVERVVAKVFGLNVGELKKKSRPMWFNHSNARFVLFSVLWQPFGFRSTTWVGLRYGVTHWSVQHGIKMVDREPYLQHKQIKVMDLLVNELELELFGNRPTSMG